MPDPLRDAEPAAPVFPFRAVAPVAFLCFLLLAWGVLSKGPLVSLDQRLGRWVLEDQRPWIRALMDLVTTVHGTLGLSLLSTAWVTAHWWRGERVWALVFALTMLGESLANSLLKRAFERPRPSFVVEAASLQSYSFPSGHSMGATVFYALVALWCCDRLHGEASRRLVWSAAAALVAAVAASRVYLGVHYLSDVVAGIAAGVAWVALIMGGMHGAGASSA